MLKFRNVEHDIIGRYSLAIGMKDRKTGLNCK